MESTSNNSQIDSTDKTAKSNNCNWHFIYWLKGIEEYIVDRCINGVNDDFDSKYEDAFYKIKSDDVNTSTNCYWIYVCSKTDVDADARSNIKPTGRAEQCLFNNPIGGFLCLPFAAAMHLLCLPFALCNYTDPVETTVEKPIVQHKQVLYSSFVDWDRFKEDKCYKQAILNQLPSNYDYDLDPDDKYWERMEKMRTDSMRISLENHINWQNSPFNQYDWNHLRL